MIELKTPITDEQIKNLKVGDEVVITGEIFTGRDKVHMRALKEELPFDAKGLAVYHCGPVVEKIKGKYKIVAAGPTTSSRVNSLEPRFLDKTKVKAIIGKGGMDNEVTKALSENNAVYLAFTGGAAQLAARGIKRVKDVYWLDLSIPEAIWRLEVERFGPMIVAIAHNKNLFIENSKKVEQNLAKLIDK